MAEEQDYKLHRDMVVKEGFGVKTKYTIKADRYRTIDFTLNRNDYRRYYEITDNLEHTIFEYQYDGDDTPSLRLIEEVDINLKVESFFLYDRARQSWVPRLKLTISGFNGKSITSGIALYIPSNAILRSIPKCSQTAKANATFSLCSI